MATHGPREENIVHISAILGQLTPLLPFKMFIFQIALEIVYEIWNVDNHAYC